MRLYLVVVYIEAESFILDWVWSIYQGEIYVSIWEEFDRKGALFIRS